MYFAASILFLKPTFWNLSPNLQLSAKGTANRSIYGFQWFQFIKSSSSNAKTDSHEFYKAWTHPKLFLRLSTVQTFSTTQLWSCFLRWKVAWLYLQDLAIFKGALASLPYIYGISFSDNFWKGLYIARGDKQTDGNLCFRRTPIPKFSDSRAHQEKEFREGKNSQNWNYIQAWIRKRKDAKNDILSITQKFPHLSNETSIQKPI